MMEVRVEVDEAVGAKVQAIRETIGRRQFDEIFGELLSMGLDEVGKVLIKDSLGRGRAKNNS